MAERFLRHRAVAARLQERGPVAVLLDDLHWADEASFELVLHLLRRPVAVPALLVIAARPVGPAARLLDAARCATGLGAAGARAARARGCAPARRRSDGPARCVNGSCAKAAATRSS